MKHQSKEGMAITIAMVFASILTLFVVSYAHMVRQSRPQTGVIDDRIKLDYLTRGMAELALLKFNTYSDNFFACSDAVASDPSLKANTIDLFARRAPEFNNPPFFQITANASGTWFNEHPISLQLADMEVMTKNRYGDSGGGSALYIRVLGTYEDKAKRPISKEVVRVISFQRKKIKIR